MVSISERELLIPWSQAQQLSLAAVFDALLDGLPLAVSPAPGRGTNANLAVAPRLVNETLNNVCSTQRVLAMAACLVAQTDLAGEADANPLVFPGSSVTDGLVLPEESRPLRRNRRAWWTALHRILSGLDEARDPMQDAMSDGTDPNRQVDLPDASEAPSLAGTRDRWGQMWEQCRTLNRRPSRIALSVSGGDLADPRYRSLQLGLVRRIELILCQFTWEDRVQQEKLASLKRLAYGASHEINNPLANIATRAQTLQRDEVNLQRRQVLETINAQAFRAFDMLANLMHYAAPPLAKPQTVDLVALAKRCLSDVPSHGVGSVTPNWCGASEPIQAHVDPQQVAVLVQALLRNADEACGGDGIINVTVEKAARDSNAAEWAVIRVTDNGPTVPLENLAVMCDPFHSGREAGRGLGFGLAKSLRIIEAHSGWLEFQPQVPRGLQVSAFLPLAVTNDATHS